MKKTRICHSSHNSKQDPHQQYIGNNQRWRKRLLSWMRLRHSKVMEVWQRVGGKVHQHIRSRRKSRNNKGTSTLYLLLSQGVSDNSLNNIHLYLNRDDSRATYRTCRRISQRLCSLWSLAAASMRLIRQTIRGQSIRRLTLEHTLAHIMAAHYDLRRQQSFNDINVKVIAIRQR